MEIKTINEIIRKAEHDDQFGETTISKYVTFSMRENIEKVDAYINSKHISGDTDSKGREKPFFNIVTAARNIWYRATDIDRKNITIRATRAGHYILAFLASILIQDWMRKSSFGKFLNEWGRVLATYGSAVVKFVEKDGELYSEVIPWNRIIVDPVDFDNNVKIEKLWLTPAQLRKRKGYDQEIVEKLLSDIQSRETSDGQKKDNKSDFIPIYEVHGELPLANLTDREEDNDKYVQQMHVTTFLEKKEERGEYEDYSLVKGKEAKDPYMITHLIKEDGRTIGIGAVENLFEAQWMQNHSVKLIKDQLDLASKLIFQTSDGDFVGQNALSSIETGDILIHKLNQPLTELNNSSHDITPLQNFGMQWQELAKEITSTTDAIRGNTQPSGTAYRLQQLVTNESHSLFELMIENKGLDITEMMNRFVIPFIKKKIDTAEEISAILEDHQVKQLDTMFIPNQAKRNINKKNVDNVLSGETPLVGEEMDMAISEEEQSIKGELDKFGKQRFIKPSDIPDKTWKEVLKDLEWQIDVDVTNESKDNESIMTTLTTLFQTLAGLNGQPMGEEMRVVFNKILSATGQISPVELPAPSQQPQQPMQPVANQLT